MKKLIIVLLVGMGLSHSLQAQWLNVFYPALRKIVFPTATTGYAIGSGGELLKTTDGGGNWVVRPSPFNGNLNTIFFANENTGFLAGGLPGGGVLIARTIDGGNSWSNVLSANTSQDAQGTEILDIVMTSNNTGFAFNSSSAVFFQTNDGGISWLRKSTLISSSAFNGVKTSFISDQVGFLIGYDGAGFKSSILKTTDGGLTWNKLDFNGQVLRSIYALDANTVYACGTGSGQGIILKSINGGATYTTQVTDQTDLFDIQFTDANTGFIYGGNFTGSFINKTTNGGASWGSKIQISSPNPSITNQLFDFTMINSSSGFAVEPPGRIHKTTDGWSTSIDSYSKPTGELKSIFFSDSQTGYAVGRNSSFLKTTNGAQSWEISTALSSYLLNSTYFTSNEVGYAVGDNGTIVKTINNGSTWTALTSSVTDNLTGVAFIDSDIGLAVGANGKIIKTVNAGSNWASKTSNTLNTLNGVSTKDGLTLAVGNSGILLKSTDSGETWIAKSSGQTVNLNGVQVVSSTLAFAAGDNGRILKSVDGGETWAPLFTNTSNKINSVYFFNANNGVAAVTEGTQAIILRTSDGGGSWSTSSIPNSFVNSTSNLNSIFSPTSTNSVAVGPGGRVYISVCSNPVISNQPGSQTITSGQTLNLSITATGTGTISYQWKRNGTNVGTNSNLLTISSVSALDAGSYTVTVSDGCGSATSSAAIINVLSEGPPAQPTNLVLTNATNTSATFSFTAAAGSPDGYLVLRRGGAAVTDVPIDAVSYTNGTVIGNSVVVYSGNQTSFTDNGLTTGSIYHYAIFSYKGSGSSINYLTTTPLAGVAQSAEPTNHVTSINFSNFTASSITVTFSAALGSPVGYLVIRRKDVAPTVVPSDGSIYLVNATIGDAMVASVGGSTTFVESGLEPGSRYFYQVFPYNGSGVSTNYLTTPSTSNVGIGITLAASPTAISAINVLFDTFTARWDPVVGADKYSLDVSENSTFSSFVTGYQGKETTTLIETVSGLKINTSYFYRVRAINSSGPSGNSNIIETKTNDVPVGTASLQSSAPTYSATFPADEQQQKVSVTLSGGLGARSVTLFHRGISATNFTSVTATAINSNQFEATITRQMLDDFGVEFYFQAKDAAFTVTTARFTIRKIFSGATSPAVPTPLSGGTVESYQIISIPLALEDNLIQTIFGSVLGEYDDTKWRIVRYQNGGNVDYPVINKIELGKSYWFNSVDKVDIKAGLGSTPDFNQAKPFVLSLDVGWNQIATPFPFAIDWDDVLAANGNPAGVGKYKVYVPSSINFAESNNLQPFSGGFVFTDQARTLNLPVTLKNTAGGRKALEVIGSDISSTSWTVPIQVSQGRALNPLGSIGMRPEANVGKDDFDDITLPRFVKYLELNSYHHEFLAPRFSKDIVPSVDEHRWNLTIESNVDEGDITLSWAGVDLGANDAQLILFDPVQGVLLDMKKVKTHTIPNTDRHEVQILYSRENSIAVEGAFVLGKPYPNPSSREVSFNVFSWSPSHTKLEVYDMMGRKVHLEETDLSGKQLKTLTWDSHENGKAPSGVYIYKIISTSSEKTNTIQGRIIIH